MAGVPLAVTVNSAVSPTETVFAWGCVKSDPATLTVQKAEPPAATPQHLNIANHLAKTYTYRLSNLRPQLPEGASWENVITSSPV